MNPDQLSNYVTKFIDVLVDYAPKLVSAFIILFVGIYAIRLINRIITKVMVQRNLDPTLTKFLSDILIWALRILL
ncbi:MAG: mechanosensitive ion channel family protein, partial [Flavobacterium sp.]